MSRRRKRLALVVAIINDVLRLICGGLIGFMDPTDIAADVVTAIVLAAILGFQWPMVCACIAEAIPGVAVFPTWTAFVLLVPAKNIADGVNVLPMAPDAEALGKNKRADKTPVA